MSKLEALEGRVAYVANIANVSSLAGLVPSCGIVDSVGVASRALDQSHLRAAGVDIEGERLPRRQRPLRQLRRGAALLVHPHDRGKFSHGGRSVILAAAAGELFQRTFLLEDQNPSESL